MSLATRIYIGFLVFFRSDKTDNNMNANDPHKEEEE